MIINTSTIAYKNKHTLMMLNPISL